MIKLNNEHADGQAADVHETNVNSMDNENFYISRIRKESIWFYAFTILAVLMSILSLVTPWFRPSSECISSWFQRSGAAMVVCSLLAESKAISIYNILNPSGFGSIDLNKAESQYKNRPALFNRVSFVIIAIGTLIWGYGVIYYFEAKKRSFK